MSIMMSYVFPNASEYHTVQTTLGCKQIVLHACKLQVTCAILWNRCWHRTKTIFAIVHRKRRSKIGVRFTLLLSNNFDHAFSAFLNQSSEYPVRTFAICENEVYGVIQQVSDLAWIDFDLDVPVILPSCSAHSANLSSAQEVSGRQKIKVNPT